MSEAQSTELTKTTQDLDRARKAAYHRAYMKKYPHKRDEYQIRYYAKKLRSPAAFKQEADPKDFLFLDIKKDHNEDVELPPPSIRT